MNRTRLILLAAVVLLAAGAYWYFGTGYDAASRPEPGTIIGAAVEPPVSPIAPPPPGMGQGAPPPDYTTPPNEPVDGTAPRPLDGALRPAQQMETAAPSPPAPPPAPPPLMQATVSASTPVSAPPLSVAIPQDIPIFPWPVPKASAAQEIPRALVVANDKSPTFGSVAARLERALDRAGYVERSYYAFADGRGVAIATQLEQINDDGSPKTGEARFAQKLAPLGSAQFSLADYIKALFVARTGRFRVIVFALSAGVRQDSKSPEAAKAKIWAQSGQSTLPPRYAAIPFAAPVTLTAMIYEFEKKDYDAEAQFVAPGKVDGMAHLTKAGIWTLLGK